MVAAPRLPPTPSMLPHEVEYRYRSQFTRTEEQAVPQPRSNTLLVIALTLTWVFGTAAIWVLSSPRPASDFLRCLLPTHQLSQSIGNTDAVIPTGDPER
jgi:hypothetical protein